MATDIYGEGGEKLIWGLILSRCTAALIACILAGEMKEFCIHRGHS